MNLDPRIHTRESYDTDAYPVALDNISKAIRYALDSPSLGQGKETAVIEEIRDSIWNVLRNLDPPSTFLFDAKSQNRRP